METWALKIRETRRQETRRQEIIKTISEIKEGYIELSAAIKHSQNLDYLNSRDCEMLLKNSITKCKEVTAKLANSLVHLNTLSKNYTSRQKEVLHILIHSIKNLLGHFYGILEFMDDADNRGFAIDILLQIEPDCYFYESIQLYSAFKIEVPVEVFKDLNMNFIIGYIEKAFKVTPAFTENGLETFENNLRAALAIKCHNPAHIQLTLLDKQVYPKLLTIIIEIMNNLNKYASELDFSKNGSNVTIYIDSLGQSIFELVINNKIKNSSNTNYSSISGISLVTTTLKNIADLSPEIQVKSRFERILLSGLPGFYTSSFKITISKYPLESEN